MRNAVTFGLNGTLAPLVVVGMMALVAPAMSQIVEAPRPRIQTQNATPSTEFEVASIRLNTSDRLPPLNVVSMTLMRRSAAASKHGRFSMRGIGATPLSVLIQVAYDVKDFQVLGAPSWATSERYDVDARAEGDATFEEMRPMLQSLLADRFTLALRRETRQLPVYELVAARSGLKIEPMKEGSCVSIDQAKPFAPLNICDGVRRQLVSLAPERREVIEAVGVPMPTLIDFVSDEVGRLVIDKTGFIGLFNFRLEFASSLASGFLGADAPAVSSSSGLSIFTAVEEQLGMRLRSTTGPAEVLVIDHVERPSLN